MDFDLYCTFYYMRCFSRERKKENPCFGFSSFYLPPGDRNVRALLPHVLEQRPRNLSDQLTDDKRPDDGERDPEQKCCNICHDIPPLVGFTIRYVFIAKIKSLNPCYWVSGF